MEMSVESEKLIAYCDRLPTLCTTYLMNSGKSLSMKTRLAYAGELDRFLDYLIAENPLFHHTAKSAITTAQFREIRATDIDLYIVSYAERGNNAPTLARKRSSLSGFFTYLVRKGYIEYNPVHNSMPVRLPKPESATYMSLTQQADFLDAIESGDALTDGQRRHHDRYRSRDLALVTLMLDTGIRVSELQAMDIEDLDLESCFTVVTRRSTGQQKLYFSDETAALLRDYLASRDFTTGSLLEREPLFVGSTGNRLTVRAIQKLVKKYAASFPAADGQAMTPQKMRASFAMSYYLETKDLHTLQSKLGHSSAASTQAYAIAAERASEESRGVLSARRKRLKGKPSV